MKFCSGIGTIVGQFIKSRAGRYEKVSRHQMMSYSAYCDTTIVNNHRTIDKKYLTILLMTC